MINGGSNKNETKQKMHSTLPNIMTCDKIVSS